MKTSDIKIMKSIIEQWFKLTEDISIMIASKRLKKCKVTWMDVNNQLTNRIQRILEVFLGLEANVRDHRFRVVVLHEAELVPRHKAGVVDDAAVLE